MFKRSWLLICLALVCVLSFSISAFAAEMVNVQIPQHEDHATSQYVSVPITDVLTWSITNTSATEDLYFYVKPRPIGWCGTVPSIAGGVVKPGETVTGSKLGVDIGGADCRVDLLGEAGTATLSVK